MGFYKIGSIIKYTRMSRGMTQEELSEGICTPESLSRIENGKITPRRKVYRELMERMNAPADRMLFPIYIEDTWVEKKMARIKYEKERMNYAEMRRLLTELEQSGRLNMQRPDVKQYLMLMHSIVGWNEKAIGDTEYLERLETALRLTFPEYCEDFSINRVFTPVEINLINNIAGAYERTGYRDRAIQLLMRVKRFFDEVHLGNDEKEFYIIYLSLASLLGRDRKYEESIAVCLEGIEKLKSRDKSNYMYNFIYNIGWNYMKMYEEGGCSDKENMLKAQEYMLQACFLNILFDESEYNLTIMKNTYSKFVKMTNF